MKYFKYFFLIFLFACKNEKPEVVQASAAKEAAPENEIRFTQTQLDNGQIVVGTAENRAIKGALKVNGVIDVPPQNLVSVSFPMGGYLKSTDLLPGMPVKKGQVIATLEDPAYIQLQQDYLVSQAKEAALNIELARQMELQAEKINAGKMVQQVQADLNVQRIMVKTLAEKLRLIGISPEKLTEDNLSRSISIYSPISGFVSKVNVHIGKYLAPTDAMFELVNTTDIHAALTIFEKDLPNIHIGQMVKITVPNQPDKQYMAKIILIGRTLDEHRAAEIHCHFEQTSANFTPGMFLSAEIETNISQALSVPNEAIVRFENKFFVFTAKDAFTFEMQEVHVGVADATFSQISPVENIDLATKKIVIKNAYTVLAKMKNTEEE